MAEQPEVQLTEDWLLGGRLNLRQPAKGHRAGTDSVLLAASLPLRSGGMLADLGAGAGTVGLIAALEQPALSVVLVERDPQLSAISSGNIERNGLSGRVRSVCADVTAPARLLSEAGLKAGSCDCVAINPPYYPAGLKQGSPDPSRHLAHVMPDAGLGTWIASARRLLKPGGDLVVIHTAEALPELLRALEKGFGAVQIKPVHALAERAAIRVIVSARLQSRAPLSLLPPLVLHGADGAFMPQTDAIMRGAARLV